MSNEKLLVEIYEEDPFTGCCGPGITSPSALEQTRRMLDNRNKTVKALKEEFEGIANIDRKIIGSRRPYSTYPPPIYKLLMARTRVPFVLIDGKLVFEGKFPSRGEFEEAIKARLYTSSRSEK
ncbi:hypothetical protein KEJ47_07000 [Candidatus Bathyarchaeota archaeon]|nr:hypothetical protein [Candidatus Bathyarchaeota archaeon]